MAEKRFEVAEVAGGRSNSFTGRAEMEFDVDGGDKVVLQLTNEGLAKTLGLAIHLQRVPAPEPGQVREMMAWPTAWWTLGHTPDFSNVTLGFELADGGHIAFQVPMDQAQRLTDALAESMANYSGRKAGGA